MYFHYLHDYVNGVIYTEALHIALRLRLFEKIGDDTVTYEEICRRLEKKGGTLKSLLHLLSTMQVLLRHGDLYWNTDVAKQYLIQKSPQYLGGHVEYLLSNVVPKIRENSQQLFFSAGRRAKSPEEQYEEDRNSSFYSSKDQMISFSEFASPYAQSDGKYLAENYDFSKCSTLCDIGGNDGSFLIPIIEAHSHLKGIVFDLSELNKRAETKIGESIARGRLRFIPGNIFHDPIPRADIYHCGFVLHDWPDFTAEKILGKIISFLTRGDTLILSGSFLDDPKQEKQLQLARDNFALVAQIEALKSLGGEKTTREYEDWLKALGMRVSGRLFASGRSFLMSEKI